MIFTASSYSEIIASTSDLKINEILASNSNINTDEYGESDDWVELCNFGDDTINLKGVFLSDSKENLAKYQIPIDTLLAPKSYVIIWTDGEPEQGPLHTNFKLSAKGEDLFVCDTNFLLLDSLFYEQQATNISLGRLESNSIVWNYFSSPSPGKPNT